MDNLVILNQNKSSMVIQDHGDGHKQDSCRSTKQVENRNLDTREVESQWLTLHEYTLAQGNDIDCCIETHYRINDASSGSNSSLRNMANHSHGRLLDMASSKQRVPKFPTDTTGLKSPGPGPAGYLKVKGQVENAVITAVKRQLGKHYRDDGPSPCVEFDPLPPGAFESSMWNSYDRETCYTGEPIPPASTDFSKLHQYPKFGEGHEYNSRVASHNHNIYVTSFDVPQVPDIPDGYIHQRLKQNSNFSNNGAYYHQRESFVEIPVVSSREIFVTESKDDCGMKCSNGARVIRTGSFSSSCHFLAFDGNLRRDKESSFITFSNLPRNGYK